MTEKLDVYSRVTDKIIADLRARKSDMVAAVAGRRTQGGSGITGRFAPEAFPIVASMF